MIAEIVDTGALVKVVWVSLTAGIGIIITFSLVVLGGIRGADARRARGGAAAVPYYALTVLALVVCGWALYRGYEFMVEKT